MNTKSIIIIFAVSIIYMSCDFRNIYSEGDKLTKCLRKKGRTWKVLRKETARYVPAFNGQLVHDTTVENVGVFTFTKDDHKAPGDKGSFKPTGEAEHEIAYYTSTSDDGEKDVDLYIYHYDPTERIVRYRVNEDFSQTKMIWTGDSKHISDTEIVITYYVEAVND